MLMRGRGIRILFQENVFCLSYKQFYVMSFQKEVDDSFVLILL